MSLAVQSVVQQMFCGDEIKASVIDIGSEQCRFGFGGQDTPRIRFRSDVGLVNSEREVLRGHKGVTSSSSSSSSSTRISGSVGMDVDEESSVRYICGDQRLRYLRPDIDMRRPFKHSDHATDADGNNIVDIDWDAVEALLKHGTSDMMSIDPTEYPMLFAENDFTSTADKTKLFELCFETMEAPAAWIANNAVLSAFSSGKPTAMVIDFGASGTRVTPVVDGYALQKAQLKTRRGGDQLSAIVSAAMSAHGIAIHPWFDVSKVDGSHLKNTGYALKAGVSASLRTLHTKDVIHDVKRWMSFVPYVPVLPEDRGNFITNVIKLPPYELPDGTLISHEDELCTGFEKIFFETTSKPLMPALVGVPANLQPSGVEAETASLPDLVRAAMLRSDVDCRKDLLLNTCLVGGGSLIDGVSPRLQFELGEILPAHLKCKMQTQLPEERQNAAWIGGSILAICGSFQQMWISRQEWLEYGDSLCSHRLH